MKSNIKYLSSIKKSLRNEIALLRLDFNVEDTSDSLRLEKALPTINFLLKKGAKVVILSHRGRPAVNPSPKEAKKFSLDFCLAFFEKKLKREVIFVPDFDFIKIKMAIEMAPEKSIFLLENLRFLPGEEQNDSKLAKQLASLGTFYINDAFAVSHRANASVEAITKYLPSYAGLIMESEIKHLSSVLEAKKRPFVFIVGGAKVSTKIELINNFLKKADCLLIGGAMANTMLKASGVNIKKSLYEPEMIETAKKLLKSEKMIIPVDYVFDKDQILDIGPKTTKLFSSFIKGSKMVVWNGPLGYFEKEKFAKGSKEIAKAIGKEKTFSIIGGGETADLILSLKMGNKFTFLSTGGGAMLEFLSGKKLPGIEALKR